VPVEVEGKVEPVEEMMKGIHLLEAETRHQDQSARFG